MSYRTPSSRWFFAGSCVLAFAFAAAASASAQTLLPGGLVVTTYGDLSSDTYVDGNPTAITLDEFAVTPVSATQIATDVIPGLVGEYGSSSEGTIQQSGNGEFLTIAGYAQADDTVGAPGNSGTYEVATAGNPNAVALAQSTDANVPRVADVLSSTGAVVSSTSFSDLYNTNNGRSVYTNDGSSIYISGQGDKSSADQGIFYSSTPGATYAATGTPPTGIYNANDTRTVDGYNGNLYYSLDKKNNPTGIYEYSPSPTTSQGSLGTQITTGTGPSPINGSTVNFSPEGFYFANADTLYVADTGDPKAGGTGDGGIQKWVSTNGINFTLAYTITPTYAAAGTLTATGGTFLNPASATNANAVGQTGFEAITGQVIGGVVDLYAVSYTAADDNPNGLYAVADTLTASSSAGDTLTEIAAAPGDGTDSGGTTGDYNFKGVAFDPVAAPEPSTWAMLAVAFALIVLVSRRRNA